VRDDRPFDGPDPPAAVYFFSRDRSGDHPERHLSDYGGILQADAYAGFNALYKGDRARGPITEAACWAHARRKFFVLVDIATKAKSKKPVIVSPIALKAVGWFDAIFEWERSINGLPPAQRLAVRAKQIAPLVQDFEVWMRTERAKLSRHAEVAKAMDYMLKR
jgi:transposase